MQREDFGAFPSFKDDKLTKPLQAADLLSRLIRNTIVTGKSRDNFYMPWEKQKAIQILTVDLDEKYFLQRLDAAFSDENIAIYSAYNPD